jgi:ribulose kinase
MWLLAQANVTGDPMQWVGQLPAPFLVGVLLFYTLTKAIPKMQDRFHEQLDKERESRERIAEKTMSDHKEAVTKIIERDMTRHEKVMARFDELHEKMKNGP